MRAHTVEWVSEVDRIFATRDSLYWGDALGAAALIWSRMAQLSEVIAGPQVKEMGWLKELDHPDHGSYLTLNTPFALHGSDMGAKSPAPAAGADTAEVLTAFGLSADEQADLALSGTLG